MDNLEFVPGQSIISITGDCAVELARMPEDLVNCVVTSPPYYGLRDYGLPKSDWPEVKYSPMAGLPALAIPAMTCCLGLEPTPEAYIGHMVYVFRLVRRVLRDDGTVWLNIGDSYASSTGGRPQGKTGQRADRTFTAGPDQAMIRDCLPDKNLLMIPARLALALQADGWVLRSDIVWEKKNPMPESVRDRPTKSHEYIFLLSKATWKGPKPNRWRHISESDRRWLALFVDTEGSIIVKRVKRPTGQKWYGAMVSLGSTNYELLNTARDIVGHGNLLERPGKNAPMYYWQLTNRMASSLLKLIYPYLIVKRRQANIVIYLQSILRYRGKRGKNKLRNEEESELLERLWEDNKSCNHFGDPDLSYVPGLDELESRQRPGRWVPNKYWYDAEAIKEKSIIREEGRTAGTRITRPEKAIGPQDRGGNSQRERGVENLLPNGSGRNKRTVWTVNTQGYPAAHFAVFPPKLIEPCILAGCPPKVCATCGAPYEREVEKGFTDHGGKTDTQYESGSTANRLAKLRQAARENGGEYVNQTKTIGWSPTCDCKADTRPGIVLDPFAGSGTTGRVAVKYNRRAILIDLSEAYAELQKDRTQVQVMLPGMA